MWNLVPHTTRSEDRFVQEYIRTHPYANKTSALQKYRKAMRCMFGITEGEEENIVSPQKRLRRPEEGAAAATSASAGAPEPAFPASGYIPFRTGADLRLVDLTEREHALCHTLPGWMNALVESVEITDERTAREPFQVFMNPSQAQYIMGVCGAQISVTAGILKSFRDHPIFSLCYREPFIIALEFNEFTGMMQDQIREFLQPRYKIAMLSRVLRAERVDDFSHAGLLIKDTIRDSDGNEHTRLIITDPHGSYSTILTRDELGRVKNLIEREFRKIVKNVSATYEVQHQDQATVEGSCVAMAFMRMCYLSYRSFVERNDRLTTFLMEPIPCVFAVFVSRLFQRVGVITPKSHTEGVTEARRQLGDYSFVEKQPTATREEVIEYLKQKGAELRLNDNRPPGVSLSSRITNLMQNAFPGQKLTLLPAQYREIENHIKSAQAAVPPPPAPVDVSEEERMLYSDFNPEEVGAGFFNLEGEQKDDDGDLLLRLLESEEEKHGNT